MSTAYPQPLLPRLAFYFVGAALAVVTLSEALPGRPAPAAQFARAELFWHGAPGSRVMQATEYVDAKLCRDLAAHAAGASESSGVEVVCHFD